jgi:hypothetical protein
MCDHMYSRASHNAYGLGSTSVERRNCDCFGRRHSGSKSKLDKLAGDHHAGALFPFHAQLWRSRRVNSTHLREWAAHAAEGRQCSCATEMCSSCYQTPYHRSLTDITHRCQPLHFTSRTATLTTGNCSSTHLLRSINEHAPAKTCQSRLQR